MIFFFHLGGSAHPSPVKQSLIDKRELQRLLRAFKTSGSGVPAKKATSSELQLEEILGSQYSSFVAANGDDAGTSAVQVSRRVMAPRPTGSLVEESFKVVSALSMPRLRYDTKRHRVERLTSESALLLGSADSKTNMYKYVKHRGCHKGR